MQQPTELNSWAIVELMGHCRIYGKVTEEERFGVKMGRVDIPAPDGTFVTQYFGGGSVYRLTLTDEATVKQGLEQYKPAGLLTTSKDYDEDDDSFDDQEVEDEDDEEEGEFSPEPKLEEPEEGFDDLFEAKEDGPRDETLRAKGAVLTRTDADGIPF